MSQVSGDIDAAAEDTQFPTPKQTLKRASSERMLTEPDEDDTTRSKRREDFTLAAGRVRRSNSLTNISVTPDNRPLRNKN